MKKFWLLVVVSFLLFGCVKNNGHMDANDVKSKINEELQLGSTTCEQIESFLKESGWGGSFDRFNRGYQITIRQDSENYKAISVFLHVDDDCVFQRSEVKETYTMP